MLHAVIMAGGSGTRFWPESRADRPKQLLPLAGPRSLIQDTVDRLAALVPPERVLVVTAARLVAAVRQQLPDLPAAAVIGEPCRRDTAPCVGLAALLIQRRDPDATLAVMPADHAIGPSAAFVAAIQQAAELVERQPNMLITFGIRPTYPAESFGYIERGPALAGSGTGPAGAAADTAPGVYAVARFREKPPAAVAREYLAAGNFYWNSGIFIWRAGTIIDELARHQPEMLARLRTIAAAADSPDFQPTFEREFAAIRGISIDYAVMEKSQHVAVIEAPFQWDDVGSWQAIARLRGADAEGNTIAGKQLGIDTTGTIVLSTDDHLIATVGLRDAIVVHTPDATLVANRNDEESIRRVAKLLEERGWKEYL